MCLGTWGVFLDHLIMMSSGIHGGQSPPTNSHYERCVAVSARVEGCSYPMYSIKGLEISCIPVNRDFS